jgi:hypothetical protein
MWQDLWDVVAESDRAHWDFQPLQRVGPLRFGMGLREAIAAMDAQGFTSGTSAINNFGPHKQVRATFRRAVSASAWHADVVAYFVDSIGLTASS